MEAAGLFSIAALLVLGLLSIPFHLARGAFRMWQNWRVVPLVQRNHTRAGIGAFGLVALAIFAAKRGLSSMTEIELYAVAGLAAFAALWLVVGVIGSRGARFDPMSVFWLGVISLGAIALLLKGLNL
jgi:hypothetical protein